MGLETCQALRNQAGIISAPAWRRLALLGYGCGGMKCAKMALLQSPAFLPAREARWLLPGQSSAQDIARKPGREGDFPPEEEGTLGRMRWAAPATPPTRPNFASQTAR
jgi:hypothetical protein